MANPYFTGNPQKLVLWESRDERDTYSPYRGKSLRTQKLPLLQPRVDGVFEGKTEQQERERGQR